MLPHPDQGSTGRLQIVNATVWLMIEIGGERVEIDINRLMREPFWSISLHSKHEGEVILTRNPEIEEEFAKFSLTIGKTVDG